MKQLPNKLQEKLTNRKDKNSLRRLGSTEGLIDFSSNDYLGISASEKIFKRTNQVLQEYELERNGASGSRLLSGNNQLYLDTENNIASFHATEAALIFNSGYDANIGFFSSVPQRGDIILYDEFIHASIRDGITMSQAKGYKFKHNDIADLREKLGRIEKGEEVYVVTESVFSMDGDMPDLKVLADVCSTNNCHLIVDEAHALGVIGSGKGLVNELGIEDQVFARIVTFGKALGCHGAAILGSQQLKSFLVNFARSFIYTTALPPHSVASIRASYEQIEENVKSGELKGDDNCRKRLNRNIAMLRFYIKMHALDRYFIESTSAIHSCIIPGNENVKSVSEKLKENGLDIKAILSPTVPEGKERLRICIHSYNTEKEIEKLVKLLVTFIQ